MELNFALLMQAYKNYFRKKSFLQKLIPKGKTLNIACIKLIDAHSWKYLSILWAYLDPSQTSRMEIFCEKGYRLLVANYFHKKAPS